VAAAALVLVTGTPPPARADDAPDGMLRRHRVGVEAGSTSFFQIVYRLRLDGPLHVETGIFGVPESGVNLSLGGVIAVPGSSRFYPYGGWGVAVAGLKWVHGDCSAAPGCSTSDNGLRYVYLRAGVGVALGRTRGQNLEVDVGGWWGQHTTTLTDVNGTRTSSSRMFLWPMAGLSYFFAI
jgi:hypothetical protein